MTYKEILDYINKNITDEALKTALINKLIQIQVGFGSGIDENSGNSLEQLSELQELYEEITQAELLQYKKNTTAYYDYLNSFLEKKTDENTKKTSNKRFITIIIAFLVFSIFGSCISYTKITQEQQQEQEYKK